MQNRIYKIKNSTLSLIFGNIVDSDADVIVSSDDTDISMGGGVSRAILKNGGEVIQTDARKKLPIQAGDVVVSTAGNLRNKFVFHCISVNWHEVAERQFITNEELTQYIISHSVEKCFRLIHALECDSIAFPLIGSGSAEMSFQQVAELMADVITANLQNTSKALNVYLYVYDHLGKYTQEDYISLYESFASYSAISKYRYSGGENYLEEELTYANIKADGIKKVKSCDIFISYSRKDQEQADKVCGFLKEQNLSYWIDKTGVYSGLNFKSEIVDAIEGAKVVLFLSSTNSNESEYVVREIEYAVCVKKPVIPIMLDSSPFAKQLRMDLSNIDQIDFKNSIEGRRKLLTSLEYNMQKKV